MRRLFNLFLGVIDVMAMVYATLIVKGVKKFSDVPAVLQPQVRQILTDLEVPELAQ